MLINLQIKLLLGFPHQIVVYGIVLFTDLDVSLLLLFGAECGTLSCILVPIHLSERGLGSISQSVWIIDAIW